VETDLTNRVDDVPERFDPVAMRGDLVEAEHVARYAWAARLAAGRRVLDAGCGLGYGSELLLRAGAAEVTGVDVAEAVVEAARARAPEGITFVQADLVGELGLSDGQFDLVVCFEVIEHLEERDRAITEMRRVLAPGGLLVMSSPNRDVYVPGNPHHVHEYEPEELRATLGEAFTHVQLWRQHNWITSAVLDDGAFASGDGEVLGELPVSKAVGLEPGKETYTLALASDAEPPALAGAAVMTGTVELRKWLDLYDEQHEVLRRQHEHFEGLRDQTEERRALSRQLIEAERAGARVLALEQERGLLGYQHEQERARLSATIEDLQSRLDRAEAVHRDMIASPSWRLTGPLRALKGILR